MILLLLRMVVIVVNLLDKGAAEVRKAQIAIHSKFIIGKGFARDMIQCAEDNLFPP